MISSPPLMEFASLTRSLGARFVSHSGKSGFFSVSIDSRSIQEGALFVALCGSSTDGHRFLREAFACGAGSAMVDSSKLEQFNILQTAQTMGKDLVIVDNTLQGLQDTARVFLEGFPGLLKIGITGSSGKTTVKEITAAIIGIEKNVVMNSGNLNSETGLPLSVFSVRSCHEVGIFEMGMNRKGEISELAHVLKPNIALITNIGSAHIGIIGSKDNIALEKKNIFSFFTGKQTALIPAFDPYCDFLSQGVNGNVQLYGADSFEELQTVTDRGLEGTEILWADQKIHFGLCGAYNVSNALAAIAIAKTAGVSNNAIKRGLESVKPLFGRTEIVNGRATVIRDCYNANPESFARAIEFCDSLKWPGRKVYVAGNMGELGTQSRAAHENAGRLLENSKADKIFLFGDEMAQAAQFLDSKDFYHTISIDELSQAMEKYILDGDLVLLKGSRSCALERVCSLPVFTSQKETIDAA